MADETVISFRGKQSPEDETREWFIRLNEHVHKVCDMHPGNIITCRFKDADQKVLNGHESIRRLCLAFLDKIHELDQYIETKAIQYAMLEKGEPHE